MPLTVEPRHQCYKCQEELVFEVKIGRLDTCPNCGAYLHSCRNCRFWSLSAHNQCLENQGEFIRDREGGNFCGFYQFRVLGEDNSKEIDGARSKLESLFGKSAPAPTLGSLGVPVAQSPEDAARARLEALFKK
jgi:predicted RNA-binding Zn-ribbon protein involved in translation (DUF1610 family)